jgi:hypothetical protein
MSTMENEIIGMIAKRIRSAAPAPVTLVRRSMSWASTLDVIEMAFDLEERFNIEIPFNANNRRGRHSRRWAMSSRPLDGWCSQVSGAVPRVVITGLGVVSPAGQSVRDLWPPIVAGDLAIRLITLVPASS